MSVTEDSSCCKNLDIWQAKLTWTPVSAGIHQYQSAGVYCLQIMLLYSASYGDKIISFISLVFLALLVRTEAKSVPQLTNRNLIQIYELMRVKVKFRIIFFLLSFTRYLKFWQSLSYPHQAVWMVLIWYIFAWWWFVFIYRQTAVLSPWPTWLTTVTGVVWATMVSTLWMISTPAVRLTTSATATSCRSVSRSLTPMTRS